jgi:hypothetical protein
MPSLVQDGLSIKDVSWRRCKFKAVRIGQIFYSYGRWWQKRTTRTGVRADDSSSEYEFFRGAQSVRVFDETKPLLRPVPGLSYDEFISQSAL